MKKSILPTILVAVYGTLRRNCGNWEHYLNNNQSEYLGDFKTEPIYSMYSLGGFPAVQEKGDTSITVEVFKVTEHVKRNLDGLEGYYGENESNFYGITTIDTPFGSAFMYVLNNRNLPLDRKIISGDWKNK